MCFEFLAAAKLVHPPTPPPLPSQLESTSDRPMCVWSPSAMSDGPVHLSYLFIPRLRREIIDFYYIIVFFFYYYKIIIIVYYSSTKSTKIIIIHSFQDHSSSHSVIFPLSFFPSFLHCLSLFLSISKNILIIKQKYINY